MALQDLIASLEREATAEADALLAEARTRAAAIRAEADDRTARRRRETLERQERALHAGTELALAEARRAARMRTLQARERAIERVLAAITAALPGAAASAAYLRTLPERFTSARACLGDTPGVVRCAPALAPALKELTAGTHDLSVMADAAVSTGFVLSASDGSVDVDETLAAWVTRQRPQLRVEIARALAEAQA